MKHPDRLRRPPVARMDPLRSFQTLFTAPLGQASAAQSANGAPSLSDVVSQSVELGYRLIDDYIRQGEQAARRLTERTVTPQTMVGDAQDVALRFAQHASGLATVWLEFLQLTATGSGMPFAGSFMDPFNAAAIGRPTPPAPPPVHRNGGPTYQPETERTRVRIEVASTQPTDVMLDLQPNAARHALIVHVLRATDPDKPRITDVCFQPECDSAPACLRICVPAAHPPGTYSGLIVDEASSRPVGSLSVSLAGGDGGAK